MSIRSGRAPHRLARGSFIKEPYVNDRRGLPSRAFDICVLIFVGALLLYFAVQLIEGIKYWLLGGLAIAGLVSLLVVLPRYHRDHW